MLKKETGITLLSLVITIIVLLILTGLAISAFNGNGLIGDTSKVVEQKMIENKKSEIEVSIARRVIQTSRGLDIEDIFKQLEKDEIIEKGNSNKENGRIKIEPEGYVYEIKKKSNGDWEVIYIGKEDIGQEELEIQISQNTKGLAPKVILTMVAKAESGIKIYTPPTGEIETYSSGTKEVTETYEVTKNGTYTFTVTNNNEVTKSESIIINNILEDDITYVVEPSTPTKGNVKVTITWPGGDNKGIQEIKIGNKAWEGKIGTTTEIIVTENTLIKVRVKNTFNEVIAKTITIDNIDRIAPTVSLSPNGGSGYTMPTSGNATIKTTITAIDEKELGTLQYAWSTSKETEPTNWTTFTNGATISKTDCTATTYYLWTNVVDVAGNRAEEIKVSNGFVVGGNTDAANKITLTPDKTNWTNGDVTVTATYGANLTQNRTLTCEGTNGTDYTVNGTTSVVVKTNNKKVTAIAKDIAGNTVTAELKINNIDKISPSAPTITGESTEYATSRTISVSKEAIDNKDGSEGSGVAYYEYCLTESSSVVLPTDKTYLVSEEWTGSDSGWRENIFTTPEGVQVLEVEVYGSCGPESRDYGGITAYLINNTTGEETDYFSAYMEADGHIDEHEKAFVQVDENTSYTVKWKVDVAYMGDVANGGSIYVSYSKGTNNQTPTVILGNGTSSATIQKLSENTRVLSKTFNTDFTGTVRFRAVDAVGNRGDWSNEENLYIDTNVPIVTAKQSSLTIQQGESHELSDYFTVTANGNNTNIVTTYTINGENYSNTSSLSEGTYTVTCTAIKSNGRSASTTMSIVVNNAVILDTHLAWACNSVMTFTVPQGVNEVLFEAHAISESDYAEWRVDAYLTNLSTGKSTELSARSRGGGEDYVSVCVKVTPGQTYELYANVKDDAEGDANADVWCGIPMVSSEEDVDLTN